MKITINDVREVHCALGARRWFESRGFNFRDVVKNGVDVEAVEALNDPYGNEIARRVREKHAETTEDTDGQE